MFLIWFFDKLLILEYFTQDNINFKANFKNVIHQKLIKRILLAILIEKDNWRRQQGCQFPFIDVKFILKLSSLIHY